MQLNKEYLSNIAPIIAIPLIIIIAFLLSLNNQKTTQPNKIEPKKDKPRTTRKIISHPKRLKPSNPQDYGMIVIKEDEKPATQQEWDRIIGSKMKNIKNNTDPQTWEAVQKKIREDPQKTKGKIEKIDRKVKECRDRLIEDPYNKELQAEINSLMILKSLAKNLPDISP